MVPDAGKMHFRHSDQQNSSAGRTQTPRMGFATSVLAGSGSTRHGLPPAKPKILATPLDNFSVLLQCILLPAIMGPYLSAVLTLFTHGRTGIPLISAVVSGR